MTEQEWEASDDPHAIILELLSWAKIPLLPVENARHYNEWLHRKLDIYHRECLNISRETDSYSTDLSLAEQLRRIRIVADGNIHPDPRYRAHILRDILGNPWKPGVIIHLDWLDWHDHLIPKMAQHIHDELAFEKMPILADALEEAGCNDEQILMHCRWECDPGMGRCDFHPHVTGCWVLDALRKAE